MSTHWDISKAIRVPKIVPGLGQNLATAQHIYDDFAGCDPTRDQRQFDAVGREEPTTDASRDLCSNLHWRKYDILNQTQHPEFNVAGLRQAHEDTFQTASFDSMAKQFGLSQHLEVRPIAGHTHEFLSAYAHGRDNPHSITYFPQ